MSTVLVPLGTRPEIIKLALVTDGDPPLQAAKLAALGLAGRFAVVVYCDELGGRSARKPATAPFLAALEALGVSASRAVYVGDRPDKDVAGATAAGMRAVRVLTGEDRDAANGTVADARLGVGAGRGAGATSQARSTPGHRFPARRRRFARIVPARCVQCGTNERSA